MVTLSLSEDEALVLFEWLSRLNDGRDENSEITAEILTAWSLQAQLEKTLTVPFSDEYDALLAQAKSQLKASWSGEA